MVLKLLVMLVLLDSDFRTDNVYFPIVLPHNTLLDQNVKIAQKCKDVILVHSMSLEELWNV